MKPARLALALSAVVAAAAAQQECKDLANFECPASECAPTCGSDGRTYSTPCHLWFAQCTNATLTKAGRGVCPGEVHWDIEACAYAAGTDPKPPKKGPIERDVTDSSENRSPEPSTAAPATTTAAPATRRIDPLAGSSSRVADETTTTPAMTTAAVSANSAAPVPAPTTSGAAGEVTAA